MSDKICNELVKKPWKPYDVSSADNGPGIYAIGETRGNETKYLYVGRSKDVKRRLQEHKSQNKQDIDHKVTDMFKQKKESQLKMKFVTEEKQKSLEGAYIQCVTKKNGYRPVLNKREGDCCESCASGKKRCQSGEAANSNAKVPKMSFSGQVVYPGGLKRSSGNPFLKSSSGPIASSETWIRGLHQVGFKGSSEWSSMKSSNSPKMSSATSILGIYPEGLQGSSGRPSFKPSSSPKASAVNSIQKPYLGGLKGSWGGPSFKSSSGLYKGGLKASSGRPSFTSSSVLKVSSAPSFRSSGGPKVSSGRRSFGSSGRRK